MIELQVAVSALIIMNLVLWWVAFYKYTGEKANVAVTVDNEALEKLMKDVIIQNIIDKILRFNGHTEFWTALRGNDVILKHLTDSAREVAKKEANAVILNDRQKTEASLRKQCLQETVDFIHDESFIDKIVNRIKIKQL